MGLPISPGTYGIDQSHSQLAYAVTHLGISTIRGSFDTYRGALSVGDDLASTSVTVEADATSMNSGNGMRDEHVSADDWLSVMGFPTVAFNSTAIHELGDGYAMTGDLTIRGVTQPVTFDVRYNGSSEFAVDGSTHHGFSAKGEIKRSDFGVDVGIPMVSDEVAITLDVQFIQPKPS
jgi:polyisoprenoid-binding protein YceI